ncbi:MAG: J domain-containing protein [bacterium]
MSDEEREKIAQQNRQKLQEHLAKIKKFGGKPPVEEKPPEPQPDPRHEAEQRRFRMDWDSWKKAYRGRVIDLTARPVVDTAADYALLGVPATASKDEIRRAFYRHAKENHPDKGGDVEAFRQLMDAYTRLTGAT